MKKTSWGWAVPSSGSALQSWGSALLARPTASHKQHETSSTPAEAEAGTGAGLSLEIEFGLGLSVAICSKQVNKSTSQQVNKSN